MFPNVHLSVQNQVISHYSVPLHPSHAYTVCVVSPQWYTYTFSPSMLPLLLYYIIRLIRHTYVLPTHIPTPKLTHAVISSPQYLCTHPHSSQVQYQLHLHLTYIWPACEFQYTHTHAHPVYDFQLQYIIYTLIPSSLSTLPSSVIHTCMLSVISQI